MVIHYSFNSTGYSQEWELILIYCYHYSMKITCEVYMQGQPNLVYNSIQLNGQFVLSIAAEEESYNVSMFLGDLGLAVKNPETVNIVKGHSVKNKPVIVQVFNAVHITVNSNVQMLKDTWLYLNTEWFGIKVRFHKNHLEMIVIKTSRLTREANGIIGKPNIKF